MDLARWLAVGIAVTTVFTAVVLNLRARRALSQARRQTEDARFAMEHLQQDGHAFSTYGEGPMSTPDVPMALITSCAAGDSVLFAGTGLSAAVGQPTWREALLGVLHFSEENHPDPLWRRLMQEVGEEQYDLVADLLVDKLGSATFYSYLREVLKQNEAWQPEDVLTPLANTPFAGVIANVWDDLATDLFSQHNPKVLGPGSATDFAEVLRKDQFFVLNAYGTLADDSLLVTTDAFEEFLADHAGYARFLGSIFVTRTVFFVGAGVSGIEDLLRTTPVRGGGSRRHYALVPWSTEAELHRDRLLRRHNVELLLYPPEPGHPAVAEFLEQLSIEVRRYQRQSSGIKRKAGTPLAALTLENVGPFENLHLELAEDWNVILADNGCGKSTILRAIALALCGDDERAARAGARLLNANASSGSIQVRFGSDTFETRLIRERTTVRVVPRQITPTQTGEWLVLGFPAIRGVSLRSSAPGPVPIGRGPEVDDVLPLIASEVDSRLDDLTQWLLNTLYSEAVAGQQAPATVERFFRVMSKLGTDVDFSFGGVDEEGLEILVATPDGRVPLRSVSQGMSSVLTWTGSLISRLEELRRDGFPADGHAGLVLIDEIDAHLHPSWQRQIIDAARSEFQNVQFVVTTHSPLVVGSMSVGKIWRLFRDDDKRVQSEEFEANFRGWRADQILASPVFDTDVRDIETEKLLEDYATLAALQSPSRDQQESLRKAAGELEILLPNPEQTEEARKVRDLIEHAAAVQIEALPDSERDKVLAELQLRVQEAITGSKPLS